MAFLPVISAVVTAGSAIFGGIASSNAANYQAKIAENNAKVAQQNATYALQAGAAEAEAQGRKGAARGAQLKVAQATNNVNVNTGSAVDVQEGQRETSLLDTENVEHNAQLRAYGYRTAETNFEAEAEGDKAKGTNALIGGGLNAAGSLLSNASSIGGKWTGTGASGTDNYNSGNPIY